MDHSVHMEISLEVLVAVEHHAIKLPEEAELAVFVLRAEALERGEAGDAAEPSERVGELVMRELKRLDKVAYIRFASVYRSFADIESFESALKELK